MPRPAAFFDRDGVLNIDHGYVSHPRAVDVHAGAGAALRKLRDAGFMIVVVTNQSGIARGMFTEDDLAAVNAALVEQLAREGAIVDAIYYCPHHAEGSVASFKRSCDCRKPGPGMLLAAANDHDIDLADSFMVGDTLSDIEAGEAAGCRVILIGEDESEGADLADAIAPDLGAATERILNWSDGG